MRILFVCTGNICRSPTADGMLRQMLVKNGIDDVTVDSAGVASDHMGEPPDTRSQLAAQALGYDIGFLRARNVVPEDFDSFDLMLAMDQGHLAALQRRKHKSSKTEIRMFMPDGSDVPDPYYGGPQAFADVAKMIEGACCELLREINSSQRS